MRSHRSIKENIEKHIYIFLEEKSVEQDKTLRGHKVKDTNSFT